MSVTPTRTGARHAPWTRLTSLTRRRILLGTLFGVALAARDVVLLMFAASFFAISELAPAPRALPSASG